MWINTKTGRAVIAYQTKKSYYDDNTSNSYPGQRTSMILAKPIPAWN